MKFAILGSGAVGGYFGAKLSHAGYPVSFVARGAHLQAIRKRGLTVKSPLGDFVVRPPAEDDPARIGPVDVVLFVVKSYDNAAALPLLKPLLGPKTVVLTLQNGVDSAEQVAAVAGKRRVLAGAAYIASERARPGWIEHTGDHQKIVFGEIFGRARLSPRGQALRQALDRAGIDADLVADARTALWEKFIFLAPFAALTGASRLPIGPLWAQPEGRELFARAVREVARLARAEGVTVARGLEREVLEHLATSLPSTRSSLLMDLQQGKRIEVETLLGSAVRRGAALRVPTPVLSTLYAILKPHAHGSASIS